MPDLHVDMEELAREIRLVDKKWASNIRRDLRAAVAESGAAITAAVKAESSWSKGGNHKKQTGRTSIPAATSLAVSFGARVVSVKVKVDSKKAPHGRPLESGNTSRGVLRHPVFHSAKTKGPFVDMPTRPFFFSAAAGMTPQVEAKIQAAMDLVAFKAGFKGR